MSLTPEMRDADQAMERLLWEGWTKEVRELRSALAAKDAEIERLRKACRGGNAINSTAFLLEFLSDRLVAEYGESDNTDYIRAAQERAAMLRAALARENV